VHVPKQVDVEQRRAEITDAAARLIERSGLGAATIRDVAAEAGLTTGSVTHYFADKRELLLHTFLASLGGRRSRRSIVGDDPMVALRATLEGALPADDDRRRHWMVCVAFCAQAAGDDELSKAQRDAYREFHSYVSEQVARSGIASGHRAAIIAEHLITQVDGVAIQALFDPSSWPADRQLDSLDGALRAVMTGR
jgi:AcrR family transcriptional regulator